MKNGVLSELFWNTVCKWVAMVERSLQRRPATPRLREKDGGWWR